ncbi:MAG: hypothetical protein P8075_05965 [Deltaproteobacteria bacterium]
MLNLLLPLQPRSNILVLEFFPSSAAQQRDSSVRKAHRAAQFSQYFLRGSRLRVNWTKFTVLPAPRFILHRLVALEDAEHIPKNSFPLIPFDTSTSNAYFQTKTMSNKRSHLGVGKREDESHG